VARSTNVACVLAVFFASKKSCERTLSRQFDAHKQHTKKPYIPCGTGFFYFIIVLYIVVSRPDPSLFPSCCEWFLGWLKIARSLAHSARNLSQHPWHVLIYSKHARGVGKCFLHQCRCILLGRSLPVNWSSMPPCLQTSCLLFFFISCLLRNFYDTFRRNIQFSIFDTIFNVSFWDFQT